MKTRLRAARVALLFLCLAPIPLHAEEAQAPPACAPQAREAVRQLGRELDKLEDAYRRYRWAEYSLRVLFYDRLWQARHDQLDPLNRDKREAGRAEEARLTQETLKLRRDARFASNRFHKVLRAFPEKTLFFTNCCPDNAFRLCVHRAMTAFPDKLEETGRRFERIFEAERDYRRAVEKTVADRDGLYPEDALEVAVSHKDYFTRFEMERRSARFEEDREMTLLFHGLRRLLATQDFASCCMSSCEAPQPRPVEQG